MLSANNKLIQLLLFSTLWLIVVQNPFAQETETATATAIKSQQPDERILWQLFHANKITELTLQIKQLQQRFPDWQPPQILLDSIVGKKKQHFVYKRPLAFCKSLDFHWQQAERDIKENSVEKAIVIYQRIIRTCNIQKRKETLKRASSTLNYDNFVRITQFSKSYIAHDFIDGTVFNYLKREYLNENILDKKQQNRAVNQIANGVDRYSDSELATVIAWRYFNFNQYKQAQYWFQKAQTWAPDNSNAAYGQVLSLEKLVQYDLLLNVIEDMQNPSVEIMAVAGRVYIAKAWQAYDQEHMQDAQANTDRAQQILGTDREIQELNAWIANKNGQNGIAAIIFGQLYQQTGNRKYAQPYIQAQSQVDREYLLEKVQQEGGILLEEYNVFHAKELYYRKQFLSAFQLAPLEFSDLANIDTPYLDIGGGARHKSGERGTSHLDLFRLPLITASYTLNAIHSFKFNISRISLFSGDLDKCDTEIAGFPDELFANNCSNRAANLNLKEQRLNNAVELDFSYRKDGWFSPFLAIGTTPIGGVVEPVPTFKAGFDQQTDFGHWGLEAYSNPVRESVLSYTGIKDPYRGALNAKLNLPSDYEWGRVSRTGLSASVFYGFSEHWSVSGDIDYAWLQGKHVANNTAISVSMGLGRNFNISGFDYFSVGPSFNYQHFDKNLSHFTYGHGGYFSPENYYNIGAGVNFLTDEGRDFIVKGRFVAGFQSVEEASSPWFPLINKSIGDFSSENNSGEALDFELKGVWQASQHIQLGAGAAYRKTNGYEDYTGGLVIRYTLEKRKAVYSTDIPDSLFSSYF